MRRSIFFLLLLSTLAFGARSHARPNFVTMDVSDQDKLPSRYGYFVSSISKGELRTFVIVLDRKASAALVEPSIFAHTPREHAPKVTLVTTLLDGIKRIEFSMAKADIKSCVLQLDSKPIPGTGTPDFGGYRLRLDNLAGKERVDLSAHRSGDAVEFILKQPIRKTRYTPVPPTTKHKGPLSLSIEGPSFHMPLIFPSSAVELELEFTLPHSLLRNLSLVVSSTLTEFVPHPYGQAKAQVKTKPMIPTRIPLLEVLGDG